MMDGSPSSVLSVGFGSWGSTGLVVTLGYGVGADLAALDGWLEYSVEGRPHYTLPEGHAHYTTQGRLHYTVPDDDP